MTMCKYPALESVYEDALALSQDESQPLGMRRAALRLVLAIRMEIGQDFLSENSGLDQKSSLTSLDLALFPK